MGIEKPLFIDNDATIYELPSGCLCCSAKSELAFAIDSLIRVRNDLGYVLIEASGIANVIELTNSLWVDHNANCKFHLSSVVALVDGLNFIKTINYDGTMAKIATMQISSVSNIIITKLENPSSDIEKIVREINLNCTIYYSNKLDVKEIIHWKDFADHPIMASIYGLKEHLDKSMTKFIHLNTLPNEILSLAKLNDVIASLLWAQPDDDVLGCQILRCKGIFVAINDAESIDEQHLSMEWIYTLQGVGNMYEILPVNSIIHRKLTMDGPDNKFIFITGKDISKQDLVKELQTCITNKI